MKSLERLFITVFTLAGIGFAMAVLLQ